MLCTQYNGVMRYVLVPDGRAESPDIIEMTPPLKKVKKGKKSKSKFFYKLKERFIVSDNLERSFVSQGHAEEKIIDARKLISNIYSLAS
jgi:hypothetical protein